jgi:hypothetical protein
VLLPELPYIMIGKISSHLSELKDFWSVPLPLGGISFLLATKRN